MGAECGLKVLTLDDAKAVSLFQQEARVLSQLNHPGIPKADRYFTFLPKNSRSPLHCLVMEKIEGVMMRYPLPHLGLGSRVNVEYLRLPNYA